MLTIQSNEPDSDIARLARTNKYVFLAYIGVLAATVILSVFLWISGNRLQDAIKRTGEARTEEAKRGAEEARKQAGEAFRDAGIANERAGLANDSAAKANERAGELEAANLILRTDLENASAESRSKQAELAQEQTKLAAEQRKTAEAQREAADAQLALKRHLEEVSERTKPRLLSNEQTTLLRDLFKANAKGRVAVICLNGNKESCDLAQQLADVLRAGDWEVDGPRDALLFTSTGTPVTGLIIKVQSRTVPLRAIILQQALGRVGLLAPAALYPDLPPDTVELLVGTKP